MNKRYYEHTLPIIRGSLSNTYARSALLCNTEILHDMNQQDTFIAFWWLTVCLWASPLSCKQYMNTRIL